MPCIQSNHLLSRGPYPSTSYDLRQVLAWQVKASDPSVIQARFVSDTTAVVEFDRAGFEIQKQISLDNGG